MDPYEKSKMFTKRYKKIKTLLKMVYGYDSFRSKQYEIINRIITGEDVCAIMPTGVGKSLCFQIPALYIDKPAIIISPLISLMDDQRLILEELGISSCCYNSNVANKSQMKKDILQCKYKFVYITPESIVNLKDFLQKLEEKQGISLIAIDEAHCISSYGFDFRKSYRELTFFKEILPQIPILAVTATATNIVGKDICKVLGFKNHTPIKTSFDRPNLYLEVREKSKNIGSDIVPLLKKYENKSVIIYCLTKKETAKVAEILKMHKIKCGIYHAGLDVEDKKKAHHDFVKGNVKVIAATIAFGMGINKADVRAVIHYGAPKNIEGYYQEIGRAGRDGKKAYCYAFYNFRDFKVQEGFIANSNDGSYQKNQLKLLEQMKRYMLTKQCRRQILLEYFDEDADDKCDFCDNCCGVHKKMEVTIVKTEQDVQKEAKLLIDLVESIKGKSFGIGMYINILRGSTNKSITSIMKKSKFYGSGKHRSAVWWKEMSDNLIKQGFLQQVYLKGGRFAMQVIKTTKQGIMWANMADLNGMLDGLGVVQLEPMKMITTI
ncbi:putative ATP-dependent RNA helicase [Tupanvirus deep ocean]|uniref:ATP-dependent RNA helicase n=2 Tax=Tupanvirus TaxID=2094720 RepID=A0AC62A7S1_9VIRU|nr:putative ATP-dependent RNA helicase [Tupanvirus deep ocean]QKU33769.1 putative ATP-dependent RNA helicase [Tupanvirus deep ocean]